jgi:hypothetical protein
VYAGPVHIVNIDKFINIKIGSGAAPGSRENVLQ